MKKRSIVKGKHNQPLREANWHRQYVGGNGRNWFEIGFLQFKFLIKQGLKPEHKLLDIACGSLRLGVFAIPYLQTGNYFGIEKDKRLIEAGLENELGIELKTLKRPKFMVSSNFEFKKFKSPPHFAIAQSLFTHLPSNLINDCFRKLKPAMREGGKFYATFFQSKTKVKNPITPHDKLGFWFTKEEIMTFGEENGWKVKYIGMWGHPRNQVIVEFVNI